MSPPTTPSLQLLSLNVNGLRGKQKRAALFATLQSGPWQVVALQETHHANQTEANQTEAAQWCREGAGPTAPWDGPSFWAAGTSASRGVALAFQAQSTAVRAHLSCYGPQWQICCHQMRSQRKPDYNCISLCSCRKARAHTFLPRQPTPPRSSDPELLMNPFHCWRHSRLAGLGRD